MDYLNASRFSSTARSQSDKSAAEDDWCKKLRSLGPQWYRSANDYWNAVSDGRPKTRAEEQEIFIGYPNLPESERVLVLKYENGRVPEGWGAYNLCFTMQERCRVMEKFGATAFEKADETDELNGRYEARMKIERDQLEDEWGCS